MHVVGQSQLASANLAVTAELADRGFYDDGVANVDVFLVPFGAAYGWQYYGSSGAIHIPRVSFARLADGLFGRRYTSLRDVLRHEYGHAVADLHRGLLRSRKFNEAFGASHSWDFEWEYDPEFHVSEYAATAPAEDFAETFMAFVRHNGSLPRKFSTPAIRRKWRFIGNLAKAITSGERRW